jgi:transposase InsO family protein
VKYAWIAKHKSAWPVSLSCEVLGVSASGYFEHWRRKGSAKPSKPGGNKRISDEALLVHIKAIHAQVKQEYGWPKMWKELVARGIRVGKERVRKLMQRNGIKAKSKGKFVVTTDSKHDLPIAPNMLARDFTAERPNQVWTTDITYIATDEGWLYLVVLLDLYSRQVVGWSMKEHMQASLVVDALRMAYFRRRPEPGLIVHSDRGSQYCGHEFQNALKGYAMLSSMSRKGDCWDNAPTESLWGHLKVARLHGRRFASRREAMDEVIDWLGFYNSTRLHQTLGYVSPMTFEKRWFAAQHQDRKTA